MGRWADDCSTGMERIGYDSDTNRYTFRDSDGCVYEGGEYGGNLTLISRPQRSKHDDEPIRMMPNSPTRPTNGVAVYPSSPTSPMSFRDFLPANAMTSASSPEPPRRKVTLKTPAASSLQRAQTSPGGEPPQRRQSLWNAVRSKTMPTKMRGVVDSVVRRTSGSKEHSKDRQYERLDRGSSSKSRSGPSPSRHGKYTSE